jgi:hypothetical protein
MAPKSRTGSMVTRQHSEKVRAHAGTSVEKITNAYNIGTVFAVVNAEGVFSLPFLRRVSWVSTA